MIHLFCLDVMEQMKAIVNFSHATAKLFARSLNDAIDGFEEETGHEIFIHSDTKINN